MLTVLSLGAGVQSSTLALMAAHGEVTPMPDCAIFADTQAEPDAVYRWLEWLEPQLPFPVHRVTGGDLVRHVAAERPTGKYLRVDLPVFAKAPDGSVGIINRSCTRDYKIRPIRRKVRELAGITRKRSPQHVIVEQWIGISRDEVVRMKESGEPWVKHRWPLIEAGMTRRHCLEWMERRGYPRPPRSSCVMCPFHSADEWRALTTSEMSLAVEIDARLRSRPPEAYRAKGVLYLHRSCQPLDAVEFNQEDHGQQRLSWGDECTGMCNT